MDNAENNRKTHRILKVLEFTKEYPNSNDDIKYIIITSIPIEQLETYSSLLDSYSPYIVVTQRFWDAHKEYVRNERKHMWRNKHKHIDRSSDCDFESRHPELLSNIIEDEVLSKFDRQELYKMLDNLSDKQRKRIILHYFYGYTKTEIAKIENVGRKSVEDSINNGLKALRRKGFT